MKKLFFFFPVIILLASCEDDSNETENVNNNADKQQSLNFSKSLGGVDAESDVSMQLENFFTFSQGQAVIRQGNAIFKADFLNDSGDLVEADQVSIGGFDIPYNVNALQHQLSYFEDDSIANLTGLYGDSVTVSVTNSPYGSYVDKKYNPELIQITSIEQNQISLDKNFFQKGSDLTIKWTPDNNNPNDLILALTPLPIVTQNTSLPNLFIDISDNGTYTIPSSTFVDYQSSGSSDSLSDGFTLTLYRGNQKVIDHGNGKETIVTFFNSVTWTAFVE